MEEIIASETKNTKTEKKKPKKSDLEMKVDALVKENKSLAKQCESNAKAIEKLNNSFKMYKEKEAAAKKAEKAKIQQASKKQ